MARRYSGVGKRGPRPKRTTGTKPAGNPTSKKPAKPRYLSKPSQYSAEQIDALISWIAEGMTEGEINNQAANFTPSFKVTPTVIFHYKHSRELDVDKLRRTKELEALATGLALKANRLKKLYDLAQRLEDDIKLHNRLWLNRVKSITVAKGTYERIEELEFIAPLVDQLRKVYADIAAETGGRVLRADITSKDKPIKGYVGISPEDWEKVGD